MKNLFIIFVTLLFLAPSIAVAQAPGQRAPQQAIAQTETPKQQIGETRTTTRILDEIGVVLLKFLVLAVVFEVALTPIFSWRVFLARFDGKGFKTPIVVILAFLVFWGYGLDIIKDILLIFGDLRKAEPSPGGQIISALLIAGGSDGILRIFTRLGIRQNPGKLKKKADEARKALAEKKKKAEEAQRASEEEKKQGQTTQDTGNE